MKIKCDTWWPCGGAEKEPMEGAFEWLNERTPTHTNMIISKCIIVEPTSRAYLSAPKSLPNFESNEEQKFSPTYTSLMHMYRAAQCQVHQNWYSSNLFGRRTRATYIHMHTPSFRLFQFVFRLYSPPPPSNYYVKPNPAHALRNSGEVSNT